MMDRYMNYVFFKNRVHFFLCVRSIDSSRFPAVEDFQFNQNSNCSEQGILLSLPAIVKSRCYTLNRLPRGVYTSKEKLLFRQIPLLLTRCCFSNSSLLHSFRFSLSIESGFFRWPKFAEN